MWNRPLPKTKLYAVVDENGAQWYGVYEELRYARATRTRLQREEDRWHSKRGRKFSILETEATWRECE